MKSFLDTDVLVYAIDRSEPAKRTIAQALLAHRANELVVSAQALSEHYAVDRRTLYLVSPAILAKLAAPDLHPARRPIACHPRPRASRLGSMPECDQ